MPSNLSRRGKPKSSRSQSLNVNFLYSKHGYNMQRQADTKAFKHMMVKIGNIKMHFWIDLNCFNAFFAVLCLYKIDAKLSPKLAAD